MSPCSGTAASPGTSGNYRMPAHLVLLLMPGESAWLLTLSKKMYDPQTGRGCAVAIAAGFHQQVGISNTLFLFLASSVDLLFNSPLHDFRTRTTLLELCVNPPKSESQVEPGFLFFWHWMHLMYKSREPLLLSRQQRGRRSRWILVPCSFSFSLWLCLHQLLRDTSGSSSVMLTSSLCLLVGARQGVKIPSGFVTLKQTLSH